MIYLNIRKYLESFILFLISILTSSIITTILSYFNIINSKTSNIIEIVLFIVSIIISSIYLGKKSDQKGYLEGLKLGIIIILFLALFNLGFVQNFGIAQIFFYLMAIVVPIVGAIIGINSKKR